MAYTKQTWDTTSYVNPTRMNHIEDGIANAMTSDTQGVLGAKNLLPLSLDRIKSLNTSGTWSGNVLSKNNCTYTVNTDSKGNVLDITLNGTPSAQGEFTLYQTTSESCPFNGFYLSGCTGGSNAKFDLRVSDIDVTSNVNYNNDSVISLNDTGKWKCTILVRQGVSISKVKFYPMIRYSGDKNNTYYPYAMTNQELTGVAKQVLISKRYLKKSENTGNTFYLQGKTNTWFKVCFAFSEYNILFTSEFSYNTVAKIGGETVEVTVNTETGVVAFSGNNSSIRNATNVLVEEIPI